MFFSTESKRKQRKKSIARIPLLFGPESNTLINKPDYSNIFCYNRPKFIFEAFYTHWNHKMIDLREDYMVLFLTTDLRILGRSLEDEGEEYCCYTNHERIVQRAKHIGASKIVTAHNHPSYLGLPSKADITTERKLKHFAKSHNVELVDHIILSASKWYYSFNAMFIL